MDERPVRLLEEMRVSYSLQEYLHTKFFPKEERLLSNLQERLTDYEKRIQAFSELDLVRNSNFLAYRRLRQLSSDSSELAKPRQAPFSNQELTKIALTAATYFEQGLEMLLTAQQMSDKSAPLVEYYGFLQCVKGVIFLELDVHHELFFGRHGLTFEKDDSRYIGAKIMPFGVFSALLLRSESLEATEFYLSGDFCPTLEQIMSNEHVYIQEKPADFRSPRSDPVLTFIGSWMLSTLVRYHPEVWLEICEGKTDNIITNIQKFRRSFVPDAVHSLLLGYS
ncbi:MAG: YaaC family protein, partial [Candidatus Hodarchaeales archaeon]